MHEIYARSWAGNAKRFKDLPFHRRRIPGKEMSRGSAPAQFAASGGPSEQAPSRRREIVAVLRILPAPRFFFAFAFSRPGLGIGAACLLAELFLRHLTC